MCSAATFPQQHHSSCGQPNDGEARPTLPYQSADVKLVLVHISTSCRPSCFVASPGGMGTVGRLLLVVTYSMRFHEVILCTHEWPLIWKTIAICKVVDRRFTALDLICTFGLPL